MAIVKQKYLPGIVLLMLSIGIRTWGPGGRFWRDGVESTIGTAGLNIQLFWAILFQKGKGHNHLL